jgi:hypothetical protein
MSGALASVRADSHSRKLLRPFPANLKDKLLSAMLNEQFVIAPSTMSATSG